MKLQKLKPCQCLRGHTNLDGSRCPAMVVTTKMTTITEPHNMVSHLSSTRKGVQNCVTKNKLFLNLKSKNIYSVIVTGGYYGGYDEEDDPDYDDDASDTEEESEEENDTQ